MCPKRLKSTKYKNISTNLTTSLSYIPQFDQLHFFKCIAMMVDQYWLYGRVIRLSKIQREIFDSLIICSRSARGRWLRCCLSQVELPEHCGRTSPGRPPSPLSTTVSTSPPPSVPASGSWIAEMWLKQQKWQRHSTRKPSMYLSWPSKFHKMQSILLMWSARLIAFYETYLAMKGT